MPTYYDPKDDIWPELRQQTVLLAPVRVGVDRKTGRIIVGWNHVQQSMRVIFQTRFHDRVLRRWVGSFVPHLLGELGTQQNITRFYWAIAGSIDIWEPNYSIIRIRVATRAPDGSLHETELTSTDEMRRGHMTTQTEGIYRPRGHLGDPTPENRRIMGLINMGGAWELRGKF